MLCSPCLEAELGKKKNLAGCAELCLPRMCYFKKSDCYLLSKGAFIIQGA